MYVAHSYHSAVKELNSHRIFKCMGMMLENLIHPYIQSTTILCDSHIFNMCKPKITQLVGQSFADKSFHFEELSTFYQMRTH